MFRLKKYILVVKILKLHLFSGKFSAKMFDNILK